MELVDNALVLRLYDSGESDRIATLLTRENGKLTAMAKSARASRERFGVALDLYREVHAAWRPGRSDRTLLLRVEASSRTPAGFPDFERLATAALWADFVDRFAPAGEPLPGLYDLLVQGLDLLRDPAMNVAAVRVAVSFELLAREGLAPSFGRCVECGRSLVRTAWKFVRASRGPVCGYCTAVSKEDRISPAALKSFEVLRTRPPSQWKRLRVEPRLFDEIDRFTLDLLEEAAGAPLMAARFAAGGQVSRRV